jgi:hypothetical protein
MMCAYKRKSIPIDHLRQHSMLRLFQVLQLAVDDMMKRRGPVIRTNGISGSAYYSGDIWECRDVVLNFEIR